MNRDFHKIDMATWPRRAEFEHFTAAGCGFTVTADADITAAYALSRKGEYKLGALLTAIVAGVINAHREYRFGYQDGELGYYDMMHPLFFDVRHSGDVKCLCAEYKPGVLALAREIMAVGEKYRDVDEYTPNAPLPPNAVNISVFPWIKTRAISFSIQYCATYLTPIITIGKLEEKDGRVTAPLSVYCNHAVLDGRHASRLIEEFSAIAGKGPVE